MYRTMVLLDHPCRFGWRKYLSPINSCHQIFAVFGVLTLSTHLSNARPLLCRCTPSDHDVLFPQLWEYHRAGTFFATESAFIFATPATAAFAGALPLTGSTLLLSIARSAVSTLSVPSAFTAASGSSDRSTPFSSDSPSLCATMHLNWALCSLEVLGSAATLLYKYSTVQLKRQKVD